MLLTKTQLDDILTIQLSVAWAGEGRCDPTRLGWWSTALVDEFDGLDMLERIMPKTYKWAALEVVRRVARLLDDQERLKASDPDKVRSIFHLGFKIDEQLDDRLTWLKKNSKAPQEALPNMIGFKDEWVPEMWSQWFEAMNIESVAFKVTPGGRAIKVSNATNEPNQLIRQLLGTLHTPPEVYPTPHLVL